MSTQAFQMWISRLLSRRMFVTSSCSVRCVTTAAPAAPSLLSPSNSGPRKHARTHAPAAYLNTSRGCPPSGEGSLKKGTTRDRLALRRDAAMPPPALSGPPPPPPGPAPGPPPPPPPPPARLSALVCFLRNFSSGFIPAGMVETGGGVKKDRTGWGEGRQRVYIADVRLLARSTLVLRRMPQPPSVSLRLRPQTPARPLVALL